MSCSFVQIFLVDETLWSVAELGPLPNLRPYPIALSLTAKLQTMILMILENNKDLGNLK